MAADREREERREEQRKAEAEERRRVEEEDRRVRWARVARDERERG